MEKDIYCEICKNKYFLISKTKGRISGLFCENCNEWAVVTSYFSEIELDDTIYKVFLIFNENLNIKEMKFWSNIFGINYIQLKKRIVNNLEFVYKGNATEVLNLINNEFVNENVAFNINPKFPFLNS